MRAGFDGLPVGLFADLYELTMAQAYLAEGMVEPAAFELFARRLPPRRGFLLAAGLDDALSCLESLRFDTPDLDALARLGPFQEPFLRWLGQLRFTGDVRAIPEGTPVFPEEPLLEVVAPLPQAQLVETLLVNRIHLHTLLATKAARVVKAAAGRLVVDFGMRRMHGVDAAVSGARAFHLAGVAATSDVLAAARWPELRATGTMAHAYVQAHDSELDAFRAFTLRYPETTLLVDTWEPLEGVRNVVRLARELGDAFRVRAIRLDSGDLADLARTSRAILDQAGLGRVQVFVSGDLDEDRIAALVASGAPVDGFGVGTALGTSADAPSLDLVYKLTEYAGRPRCKRSPGKRTLPGRKQAWRVEAPGGAAHEVLARLGEPSPGRPLLETVMRAGQRASEGRQGLAEARVRAARELAGLPEEVTRLDAAPGAREVRLSPRLREAAAGWFSPGGGEPDASGNRPSPRPTPRSGGAPR